MTAIPMPLMMPAAPEMPVDADAQIVNDVPEDVQHEDVQPEDVQPEDVQPEDVQDEQEDAEADAEAEIVARLRAGDRAAVETVYVAHHAAIRGFARRLVGDAASAEDIVHETFVALPRAIRRFRGEGSLRSFLIGVAANHSRRHVRSAMRRRRATERLAEREEVRPRAVDATAALITRQMAHRLWAALDELPLDQRLVFVLCEAEQRTSVEVAAIVGAPEGTVRTRLFHAKRKLREMLEAP